METRIIEGNKLIAEFMDYELALWKDEELKFNSDWNWLIPVIEKCRESQIFGSQRLIDNIDKRLLKLDLLATYYNVIDFIEFHKNA